MIASFIHVRQTLEYIEYIGKFITAVDILCTYYIYTYLVYLATYMKSSYYSIN